MKVSELIHVLNRVNPDREVLIQTDPASEYLHRVVFVGEDSDGDIQLLSYGPDDAKYPPGNDDFGVQTSATVEEPKCKTMGCDSKAVTPEGFCQPCDADWKEHEANA